MKRLKLQRRSVNDRKWETMKEENPAESETPYVQLLNQYKTEAEHREKERPSKVYRVVESRELYHTEDKE